MSAAYIQVHFRLDLIMEANTMNCDQTVPLYLVYNISDKTVAGVKRDEVTVS